MVKVISPFSFDCKIYVDDMIGAWDEADAAGNKENKPLQPGVGDESHNDACKQQT